MIKNWLLFVVSLIMLPIAIWFLVDRIQFLARAEKVDGEVVDVSARNATCSSGSRRRRRSYSCTKFEASIAFVSKAGQRGSFEVSVGSARGHNQPTSRANSRPGQQVPVLYDPANIANACRDYFMDKWGKPFMVFIFQIFTFIGSLFEGRKRRRTW